MYRVFIETWDGWKQCESSHDDKGDAVQSATAQFDSYNLARSYVLRGDDVVWEKKAPPRPAVMLAANGVRLPIAAGAVPYSTTDGRVGSRQLDGGEYRERYKTLDGKRIEVTRDKGCNDAIVEWRML